uniref:Transcription factor CP2-like 1 n=1 Tax=Sparus aurata TaxID=8175 RepID=A0A671XRM3_SPAAU
MLFCHSQPESYHQHSASYIREALAPFLKNEEAKLMAENGASRSPFQYILCAATSPAVKQQEESLTYLNQGQSYEIRMLNRKLVEYTDISSKYVKSIVRVVFHDRRLQYMEHQQLEGWRWNRPGDRILDIGESSVLYSRAPVTPHAPHTIEFLWDPVKNASVFIHPRESIGGEKGVPFRIQVDTFTSNEHGEYLEHVHSSSCQVKVFKPKGADLTSRQRQVSTSHDTTLLKEVMLTVVFIWAALHNTADLRGPAHLLPSSSPQDTQQWLHRHRFSPYSRLFTSFSGGDLLRMSREDLIQICGPADVKIKLQCLLTFSRCIQPRLTIYVCQQQARHQPAIKPGGGETVCLCFPAVYHALYLEELTLLDRSEKIALLYSITPQQITHIYRQKSNGIHVLVSDEMVQNFREETSFLLSTIRGNYFNLTFDNSLLTKASITLFPSLFGVF